MIVSLENRYVYVETPHSGSTAISAELCAMYGATRLGNLPRHAPYDAFLRQANSAERDFFAFTSCRHPLDELVSLYFKFVTNHNDNFTNPSKRRKNGGFVSRTHLRKYRFVQSRSASLQEFLCRFYWLPYDSAFRLSRARMGAIMRFEHLALDFAAVLDKLGIEKQRPLPVVNRTHRRRAHFTEHLAEFDERSRRRAAWVFGPFLEECGFEFPLELGAERASVPSRLLFDLLGPLRRLHWRFGLSRSRPHKVWSKLRPD